MSKSVVAFPVPANVTVKELDFADYEVRLIFSGFTITCSRVTGRFREEARGVFVREQRSKAGTLGYVYFNPLTRENWLWVISKKTRRPFALARVS